jgi:hypothetical protein
MQKYSQRFPYNKKILGLFYSSNSNLERGIDRYFKNVSRFDDL